MRAFDKIIGYQAEKEELMRLCDMLRNRERYQALGAKLPRGLLIHGEPGLGKTLMARCFMEAVGWKSYTVRRTQPDGDFIREMHRVFQEAADHAPAIILLDDMDKFVVEEKSKEEYVAVQAGIDEVAGKDVYVIATANDLSDIPDSLLRVGRFDSKIHLWGPGGEDAMKLTEFYLSSKTLGSSVNISDVAKMMGSCSCAELETALNEAAIYAGYEHSEQVEMRHIVKVVLGEEYGTGKSAAPLDDRTRRKIAYHEAGHAVILELLNEDGVGMVSVLNRGGVTRACIRPGTVGGSIVTALAGCAATELKYGAKDAGGAQDLRRAMSEIREVVNSCGGYGINLLEARLRQSEMQMMRQETVVAAETERYLSMTREILLQNMDFLDALAGELYEKGVLLNSDVCRIRNGCTVHRPAPEILQ